jgi:hypothetical protein
VRYLIAPELAPRALERVAVDILIVNMFMCGACMQSSCGVSRKIQMTLPLHCKVFCKVLGPS